MTYREEQAIIEKAKRAWLERREVELTEREHAFLKEVVEHNYELDAVGKLTIEDALENEIIEDFINSSLCRFRAVRCWL